MRIAAVLALMLLLSGCAGTGETGPVANVIGNQFGGKIPNGVSDTPAAMNAVVAHCAKFGKKGQITQMAAPSEGGLLAFQCF